MTSLNALTHPDGFASSPKGERSRSGSVCTAQKGANLCACRLNSNSLPVLAMARQRQEDMPSPSALSSSGSNIIHHEHRVHLWGREQDELSVRLRTMGMPLHRPGLCHHGIKT